MAETDDWRLTNQERFLQGATLWRAQWTRPRPEWDHDHCVFCWVTFAEEDCLGMIRIGYTTPERYYWICDQCFEDFKDKFEWQIEDRSKR